MIQGCDPVPLDSWANPHTTGCIAPRCAQIFPLVHEALGEGGGQGQFQALEHMGALNTWLHLLNPKPQARGLTRTCT